GDPVKGRSGRANLPEELALGDPGQARPYALQAVSAHVNRVVQFEIDDRNHGGIGHALGQAPLDLLDGVPALGVLAFDEPADLHVVKRQVRLIQVGSYRGDEVGEGAMIDLRGIATGIALPLVPEHALDLAASELDLPEE